MSDPTTYQLRTQPHDSRLVEAAKNQPGAWVYDVDFEYPPDQPTPSEAIRGAWESGPDGRLTGRFAPNDRYRAIQQSTRPLKPYMHAGARSNRNQWIVEIDPRGEHLFPQIPAQLIRGWWYVDESGKITDQFRPNSQWVDTSVL